MLAVLAVYYALRWGSVGNLFAALDHDSQTFLDFSANYLPQAKAILHPAVPVSGYFYSAFFALLLLPLAPLPHSWAMWAWAIVQVVGALALCLLPLRRLIRLDRRWTAAYVGVFATSIPILHNLRWGQVSILLTLLVVAAFDSAARKRSGLAGVLIAIAAAIKFYPAIFIVYFVFKRDWRACASFLLAFMVCYAVIPAAVLGPHNWIAFETAASGAIVKANWVAADVNSQYCAHVVSRWISGSKHVTADPNSTVWKLIGYAVVLANVAFVWLIQRRRVRAVNALVILFLSIPFVVDTSWPHYFAFLPFCQAVVLAHLLNSPQRRSLAHNVIAGLLLASVAFSSIFVFGLFSTWSDYSGLGMLLIADVLLLLCMYGIIALGLIPSARPLRISD